MDPLVEAMTKLASTLTSLMMVVAMFKSLFPDVDFYEPLEKYKQKLYDYFDPYMNITIPEYQNDTFERSKAYAAVERYLNTKSTNQAKRLNATTVKDSESVVLTMGNGEVVEDEFQGAKLEWVSHLATSNQRNDNEKNYYSLQFHSKFRKIVTESYLKHVLEEGKAIARKERRRKLYTNNKGDGWWRRNWTQVPFQHPASFDTLAMDPVKKKDIVDDLITFTKAKDYYAKVGKAWKRGYLLYGPPGTGKSTMIAAMANLLQYDIYDLELTSVKNNLQLRKLLIDTSSKSIVVIEDIDCSADLTGKRKKKKEKDDEEEDDPDSKDKSKSSEDSKSSDVTLSGLLNFIDGLWSACVGERIIVFTTNHLEKLDPALIRRGRMDKHIEMSYCCFESFKILAKNYLDLDSHELFGKVKVMLEETNMAPADVAENLMPKLGGEDPELCLMRLINAIEEAKVKAKEKAEEEEKEKAEKLAKEQEKKEKKQKKEEKAKAKAKAEEVKTKKDEKSAQDEAKEEKQSEEATQKTETVDDEKKKKTKKKKKKEN